VVLDAHKHLKQGGPVNFSAVLSVAVGLPQTTSGYIGIQNLASVSIAFRIDANFSAIRGDVAGAIAELKPQVAALLGVAENRITNMRLSAGNYQANISREGFIMPR